MRHISCPILLIHGKKDIDIRPWQAKANFLEALGLGDNRGYWDLRDSSKVFDPSVCVGGAGCAGALASNSSGINHGPGISLNNAIGCIKRVNNGNLHSYEGELWTGADRLIWLLVVNHAGHDTLALHEVVPDVIESWLELIETDWIT